VVYNFPVLSVLIRHTTDEGETISIKPTKQPPEGALISCFYCGLWLVAYYYPLGKGAVRLMDESGDVRLFEPDTLDIEGEVVSRPRAAGQISLLASKRIHHSN
jgi:hypothetical protein